MGEHAHGGDIADRPQAIACNQVLVDGDVANIVSEPNSVEAEARNVDAAPRSNEQPLGAQFGAVVEHDDCVAAVLPYPGGAHADMCCDAFRRPRFGNKCADLGLFMREDAAESFDDRDAGAESAHCLGDFGTDGAGTQHDEAGG